MTPGSVIAGKYQLLRRVGQGGMGEVWAAFHAEMGREVAIKLIHRESPDFAARLKREAIAYGRLEHQNVVRVYDTGETEQGDPFLVMELLKGETLEARMARVGVLEAAEAIEIGIAVARALRAAHSAGIIHRDLKPANVFLHRAGQSEAAEVKVLDFGVSKIMELSGSPATMTGALVGSPAYMSPEASRSLKEIDTRADLWSFGVLLFEMLSGTRPFKAPTIVGVVVEILSAPIPRLRAVAPDADERLDDIIAGCLVRELDGRYQSANAIIDALRPVLASMSPTGRIDLKKRSPPAAFSAPRPAAPAAPKPPRPPPSIPPPGDGDGEEATSLMKVDELQRGRGGAPAPPRVVDDEDQATSLIKVGELQRGPSAPMAPPPRPPPPQPPPSNGPWDSPPPHRLAETAAARRAPPPEPSRPPAEPPRSSWGPAPPAAPQPGAPLGPASFLQTAPLPIHLAPPADEGELVTAPLGARADGSPAREPPPNVPPPFGSGPMVAAPVGLPAGVPLVAPVAPPIAGPVAAQETLVIPWEAPAANRRRMLAVVAVLGVLVVIGLVALLSLDSPGAADGAVASASASASAATAPPAASPAKVAGLAPTASAAPVKTATAADKLAGALSLSSRSTVKVIIDGVSAGKTPIVGLAVPPGDHQVVFVHPTKGQRQMTIHVEAGETVQRNVRFD